jgi:HEAT repeat protein
VRRNAAEALGEIGGDRAVDALSDCLINDQDAHVRARAASALGKIGGSHAIDALSKRLDDFYDEEHVLKQGYTADGDRAAQYDETYTVRVVPASDALVRIGTPAVEPLLKAARDSDNPAIRSRAFRTLADIAVRNKAVLERVVESLVAFLKVGREEIREGVAEAFEWIGPTRGFYPLIGLLGDNSCRVRRIAAAALGRFFRHRQAYAVPFWDDVKQSQAVDALLHMLEGDLAAGRAVLNGRVPEPHETMASFLVHEKGVARLRNYAALGSAVEALSEFADPRAVDVLVECMMLDSGVARDCGRALRKIGAPAIGSLLKALRSEHESVREIVVEVLGEIHDPQAVEPLIAMLTDKFAGVRASAAKLLGIIGDARAIDGLILRVSDQNERPRVRAWAAGALGKIGGNAAAAALAACAKDSKQSVQEAVVQAMRLIEHKRSQNS